MAGERKLAVTTRYFIDSDDQEEWVSFTLEGTDLVQRWPEGSTTRSRVLLSNVTRFNTSSLRFFEDFNREDYDLAAPAPIGDVVDPETQVEYKLAELTTIKAALAPYVRTDRNRLEVPATLVPRTLTVSPGLKKKGLRIEAAFSPLDSGVEYQPIVWGDAALNQNQVAIVFDSDQSIRIVTHESGAPISQSLPGGITWSPQDTYQFRVKFGQDSAIATMSVNGGRYQRIGKVDTGTLDNKAIRLRTVSSNARASWDAVDIDYPFVDVHFTVDAGSRELDFWGGATKRERSETP